ncbi:sensor histidine kinase [Streptomyces sp. NPDC101118]|uniref:sensor histidine kinase n=1 Tax=Streptomyces sp. NPDC101118 TaxID=3366109 RepID=UPI00381C3B55
MHPSRPAPWIPPLLYAAVLAAGWYAAAAGLGDTGRGATRPLLFTAGLAALLALDLGEARLRPGRTPVPATVALLALRAALIALVAAADGSGLSRVLFVLVPFTAYFALGRAWATGLAAACLALVPFTTPRWYADPEAVSDLLMLGLGLVLTLAMASGAVAERRLRARLEESYRQVAELSAAAERTRVARDVHDGLGHHLTAVVVQLEKARAFSERDAEASRRAVEDAHRSARQALADVRTSVRALRAEPFRLRAALDALVGHHDDVTLHMAGEETAYGTAALTAFYRAAQEGITNARRHASARRIEVTVDLDAAPARLTVTDDGRGIGGAPEGFGLRAMRERVELAGGSVDIAGAAGTGTRLTVTLPRPDGTLPRPDGPLRRPDGALPRQAAP